MTSMTPVDSRNDPTLLILFATVATTFVGAAVGAVVALLTWEAPASSRLLAGLASGAAASLVVAFSMAWHGASIAQSPGRSQNAAIWGLVPAALIGASIGPPLAGVTGMAFDQLPAAMILGLLLGPLVAVISWELAFWGQQLRGKALR